MTTAWYPKPKTEPALVPPIGRATPIRPTMTDEKPAPKPYFPPPASDDARKNPKCPVCGYRLCRCPLPTVELAVVVENGDPKLVDHPLRHGFVEAERIVKEATAPKATEKAPPIVVQSGPSPPGMIKRGCQFPLHRDFARLLKPGDWFEWTSPPKRAVKLVNGWAKRMREAGKKNGLHAYTTTDGRVIVKNEEC